MAISRYRYSHLPTTRYFAVIDSVSSWWYGLLGDEALVGFPTDHNATFRLDYLVRRSYRVICILSSCTTNNPSLDCKRVGLKH